jgi:hypothetical protein
LRRKNGQLAVYHEGSLVPLWSAKRTERKKVNVRKEGKEITSSHSASSPSLTAPLVPREAKIKSFITRQVDWGFYCLRETHKVKKKNLTADQQIFFFCTWDGSRIYKDIKRQNFKHF